MIALTSVKSAPNRTPHMVSVPIHDNPYAGTLRPLYQQGAIRSRVYNFDHEAYCSIPAHLWGTRKVSRTCFHTARHGLSGIDGINAGLKDPAMHASDRSAITQGTGDVQVPHTYLPL